MTKQVTKMAPQVQIMSRKPRCSSETLAIHGGVGHTRGRGAEATSPVAETVAPSTASSGTETAAATDARANEAVQDALAKLLEHAESLSGMRVCLGSMLEKMRHSYFREIKAEIDTMLINQTLYTTHLEVMINTTHRGPGVLHDCQRMVEEADEEMPKIHQAFRHIFTIATQMTADEPVEVDDLDDAATVAQTAQPVAGEEPHSLVGTPPKRTRRDDNF